MRNPETLVGRDELIEEILGSSGAPTLGFTLHGDPGTGKTALVAFLKEADDFFAVRADMQDFNPGLPGDAGDAASVGAIQANFQQFRDLLVDLLTQAYPDAAAAFQEEVTAASNRNVAARRRFTLEEAMRKADKELTPSALAKAWKTAQKEVQDHFINLWNDETRRTADERLRLILLDNMDDIADQEMDGWLDELLWSLEHTLVVLTRTADRPAQSSGDRAGTIVARTVANFGRPDVGEYLTSHHGISHVSPEEVAKVFEITDGHPGTVSMVYDLVWQHPYGDGDDPSVILRDLPLHGGHRRAQLAERLLALHDEPGERSLSLGLDAAAIPRRFDNELLRALLKDTMHDDDVGRLFERLASLPFVEELPGKPHQPQQLRLHSFVREELLDRLLNTDTPRYTTLHMRAADYFNHKLTKVDADQFSPSYEDAFAYENADWQRNKREWLYHSARAMTDESSVVFLLQCARVFLEVFWWWGSYVHFDFCDQLIADVHHVSLLPTAADDIGRLERGMTLLLMNYPNRDGAPDVAGTAWPAVEDALDDIQLACGIDDTRHSATDLERKVASLIEIFMAHCCRYGGNAPNPAADDHYKRAEAGFKALDDEWGAAWVSFERADLRLELGLLGVELRTAWDDAARGVQPEAESDDAPKTPDEELVANLHRLRADLCWKARSPDYRRAATWYRRAVLHAYLFHDIGNPPDEYTLQFYVDMQAAALKRLDELRDSEDADTIHTFVANLAIHDRDESADVAKARLEKLEALVDSGAAPIDLANALFPAPPTTAELGMPDSEFGRRLRHFRRALIDGAHDDREHEDHEHDLRDREWP